MPPLHAPVPMFNLGGMPFRVDAWVAWQTRNGRTVFRGREYLVQGNDGGYYANDTVGFYLWEFTLTGGNVALVGRTTSSHKTLALWEANQFLDNPAAWDAHENDRIREANIGGGLAHAIGGAIHSIGNVVSDVVDFGIEVNLAALHPLTVSSSGLALSNEAIGLVPEPLQGIVQTATAVAGYGVLAGAAITAVGGIGAVQSAIESVTSVASGVSTAIDTATGLAGAIGLVGGVTPILSNDQGTAAGAAYDARARSSSSLVLVAAVVLAFVLIGGR